MRTLRYGKRRILAAVLLLAAALTLTAAGCGTRAEKDMPLVVATNFALYDIARQVAGECASVEMLLPPETESHGYEITLADAAKIGQSDLFVYVGGESEDWVFDLLGGMREEERPRTMAAIEACGVREESSDGILEPEDEEEGGEEEPEADEHVWTSFENVKKIAEEFARNLSALLPGRAGEIEASLADYLGKVSALREEYAAFFGGTERRFIAVADRFPFRYLAEEWDLSYIAAFSGCSSNTEASLATVNALVDAVKENGLPAVFVIELSDGRCASAVARETGCGILTLESGHNVTKEDFDSGVTLLELMERNLAALKTVLE